MMRALLTIYGWLLRLLPIAMGVLGWYAARWLGLLVGLCLGAVAAIAIWIGVYWVTGRRRISRQMREVADLPTERLMEMAVDPLCRRLGFAMGELKDRGIIA